MFENVVKNFTSWGLQRRILDALCSKFILPMPQLNEGKITIYWPLMELRLLPLLPTLAYLLCLLCIFQWKVLAPRQKFICAPLSPVLNFSIPQKSSSQCSERFKMLILDSFFIFSISKIFTKKHFCKICVNVFRRWPLPGCLSFF